MEITNEITSAFKKYEELKQAEREIAKQIDELKPLIMPYVPEDKEVEGDNGVFYIQKRAKWKYSASTIEEEKALKSIKAAEEANGTAEATYTPVLYYKSAKVEEVE